MNNLESRLNKENPNLYSDYEKSRKNISPFLEEFRKNFPEFTDHSIKHSDTVSFYISEMLSKDELFNLNLDEIYILLMACILHDIGMAIPKEQVKMYIFPKILYDYLKSNPDKKIEQFMRDFHHELSYNFIIKEYKELNISSEKYAEAIALVSKAHRKVDLLDYESYPPKMYVRSGSSFIGIPYLGCLLRIADELDITEKRISKLVLKYYPPEGQESKEEIEKHKSNLLVNFDGNLIKISAKCNNPSVFYALSLLYKKIEEQINYCNKVISNIKNIDEGHYKFSIRILKKDIKTEGFVPKNIGFSFELKNIFKYFIGKNLYSNKFFAIREVLQNAIETCRYKKYEMRNYTPKIEVNLVNNTLEIKDNGMGMNEFIVKEFFSKLANSYYNSQEFKDKFESIATYGIGVFSYFLICDSFEVNTKMKNEKPLRFRVNKNFKSDFYFFDDNFLEGEGTKITFFLTDNMIKKLTIQKLNSIIKHFIRDVEIPIKIISNGSPKSILQENYIILLEELSNFLKETQKDKIHYLKLFTKIIKNKKFKGVMGTILPLNNSKVTSFNYIGSWVKHLEIKDINLSYKGIYINIYNFHRSIFRHLFGKLNILNKLDLRLDKLSIYNNKMIISIIELFEASLLYKISKIFKLYDDREIFIKTNLFFLNFIDIFALKIRKSKILNELCLEILYVDVLKKKEHKYLSLKNFLFLQEDFFIHLIVSDRIADQKQCSDVILDNIGKNECSLLLVHYDNIRYVFHLINYKNVSIEIHLEKSRFLSPISLYVKHRKELVERLFIEDFECVAFNSNFITIPSFNTLKFLNKNHPIINFWIKHSNDINSDNLLKEIFNDIRLFIERISIHGFEEKFLEKVNNQIKIVNNLYNINLKLEKKDIPYNLFHII